MLLSILILELNSPEEMIWNVLDMYLFTSFEDHFLGKDSKLKIKKKNMMASGIKNCKSQLKNYAKAFPKNFKCI